MNYGPSVGSGGGVTNGRLVGYPGQIESIDAITGQEVFTINNKRIVDSENNLLFDQASAILDSEWAKKAFMVPDMYLDDARTADTKNRYWSSVDNKFTDTSLGGNIGINPRPQFTPYSDVRVKGRRANRQPVSLQNTGGNHGMGRIYGELIDDHAHRIFVRFGVPMFNGLFRFFSSSFDPNLTSLARTGRGLSKWYTIGKIVGTYVFTRAFPIVGTILLFTQFVSGYFSSAVNKFYTMKPTMHLYWCTVNNIVNAIGINKGIMPNYYPAGKKPDQQLGDTFKPSQDMLRKLHELMPDVFSSSYGFDMFAVANRAQRVANQMLRDDWMAYNSTSDTDFTGFVQRQGQVKLENPRGEHTLMNFLTNGALAMADWSIESIKARFETQPNINPDTGEPDKTREEGFFKYLDAEFKAGSSFATFIVDSVTNVQESFSSAVVESDLSTKLNGISSQIRDARFTFADGNITGTGVEEMVKGALSGVTDLAQGLASGVTMGLFDAVKGLMGSGFIDIPKHWQSSSASLPKVNYTATLISPYGNPISDMINIQIPLAMLLAGCLPLSTGKSSYTSPFLCQVFDRGRMQIRLGIMESLTVSRGEGNLPFTPRGRAVAVNVSFSFTDLSSLIHMPVSSGSLFETDMTTDDDNLLKDYLAVIAGQDIYSQIYAMPKALLTASKQIRNLERLTSPAYWASTIHTESTTGMMSYIMPIGRLADAFMPGATSVLGTAGRT